MTSLVQVNEALGKVVTFLAPVVPLLGCHMVDFLTHQHWDTLLPPQLQQDLLSIPSEALHLLPSAALPHMTDQPRQCDNDSWSLSSSDLPTFLSQVRRHCPADLGMVTPIEQILSQYGSTEISVLPMKGIMSDKKAHEVEVMGQVIARLAKGLGVNWLVDVGSGRGYLSTSLVLQYSQRVVAIDSSTCNTSSALNRNAKLKRWWNSLKQTWQDRAEGQPVKKGKTRRKKVTTSPQHEQKTKRQENKQQEDMAPLNAISNGENFVTPSSGCYIGVTRFITEKTDLLELVRNAIMSEMITCEGGGKSEDAALRNESGPVSPDDFASVSSSGLRNAGLLSSSCGTGIDSAHSDTISKDTSDTRRPLLDLEDMADLLTPSCDASVDLIHISATTKDMNTRKQSPDSLQETVRCKVDETLLLGLVGLHTCGNLASSSLRLFVANPRVDFLCNVGCCYHLIEEEFSSNMYNQRKVPDEEGSTSSSTHKEKECVPKRAEEEKLLLSARQESVPLRSSTSHPEQGKNTNSVSPVYKEECSPKYEDNKQFSTLFEQNFESSKSFTKNIEQEKEKNFTTVTHNRKEAVTFASTEEETCIPLNKESSTSHIKEEANTDLSDASYKKGESVGLPKTKKVTRAAPGRQSSTVREEPCEDLTPLPPQSHLVSTTIRNCGTNAFPPLLPPQGHIAPIMEGEEDIDPLHPSTIPNLSHGFPLGSFLREKRFALGRNSRMLSSQAADRMTQGSIGGAQPLYWRALLQVVLVDRLGDVSDLSHVGRLSAKCHTFSEYVRTAVTRLGVSLDVTEEELQEYDRRHSSSRNKLERFFLLRASLAAVVEGAVLLDRLAFLCEQDDVSAYLVQLFDPVTSPRSHALIAVRKRRRNSPIPTRGRMQ